MDYLPTGFITTYKQSIIATCLVGTCILVSQIDERRDNRARKTIKNVESEKMKVISNRDHVKKKIEATDRLTERVNDDVFEWLRETEIVLQEVQNMTVVDEHGQLSRQEKHRQLTNDGAVKHRHKMLDKLKALNIRCEFKLFSSTIPSLEHFSSEKFVCFASTKEASDRLLQALQNDNSFKIGLYGKRGSGKTTLVKAVAEKAKYSKFFDVVLCINVSQDPNIKRIQDEIANELNLEFDVNTEAGRTRKIYLTLANMDRQILVILDDVAENLDPEKVGIPCNSNRCKVLLTTCRQQDCEFIHCQREIQLSPLSTEEAWTLFKRHSGIDNESSSDLKNVAYNVAIECEGLPRTIEDEGSSLRSKPIEEWKASLDRLKYSRSQYDIFLSFKGEDTRYSFTGFLYNILCREGFKTFMDDEGLKGGNEISSSLIKAIEASRISIVVFSKNFADSPWCLDELVTMLKCKERKNQQILPIFYNIEPSCVRHQRNSYGKAMAKHKEEFGNDSEKVNKWRSALFEVANLSGIHHKYGYEYEYKLVQKIVERIRSQT